MTSRIAKIVKIARIVSFNFDVEPLNPFNLSVLHFVISGGVASYLEILLLLLLSI